MIDWPLDSNIIRRCKVSNTFGMVRRNALGLPRAHQGHDYSAPIGTKCYAIADGRVAMHYESKDYGKVLVLDFAHQGKRWFAAYCHLLSYAAVTHAPVKIGELIGRTGDTGNARGLPKADEHLHFEIRTMPRPGKGLDGRVSPIEVFGVCPLWKPIMRNGI